ncbi:hypothetical protein R3P38DRAFT_241239 [Favolaschia claudopus]|uniref:Uncharacterized protein n=1 Tax=Favolaschia claudopus TaxID=2862362 RepID=A0AAW0CWH9_9AGAR
MMKWDCRGRSLQLAVDTSCQDRTRKISGGSHRVLSRRPSIQRCSDILPFAHSRPTTPLCAHSNDPNSTVSFPRVFLPLYRILTCRYYSAPPTFPSPFLSSSSYRCLHTYSRYLYGHPHCDLFVFSAPLRVFILPYSLPPCTYIPPPRYLVPVLSPPHRNPPPPPSLPRLRLASPSSSAHRPLVAAEAHFLSRTLVKPPLLFQGPGCLLSALLKACLRGATLVLAVSIPYRHSLVWLPHIPSAARSDPA